MYKYYKEIKIQSEHLDELQHVNNAIYVQWVQEVAGEHWLSRYTQNDIADSYWVLLEHNIQYKGEAFLNDILRVESYVEKPIGLRFPRIVNFYKADKIIVESRTLWCWIDSKTKRPKRIGEEVLNLFL